MLPASFGRRFAARAVDTIVGFFAGAMGGLFGGFAIGVLSAVGALDHGAVHRLSKQSIGSLAFGMLGPLVYHTLAEGLGGATVGKLACGIRVVKEDGGPPTLVSGLLRNIAYYVDAMFFGIVAYSVMSGNALKQRLGDKWGHTAVVMATTARPEAQRGVGLPLVLAIGGWIMVAVVSAVMKVL